VSNDPTRTAIMMNDDQLIAAMSKAK